MTNDDELVETLSRLGRTATPPPDSSFANRLDAHLRTLRAEPEPGRGARSPLALSLAGLAGVIVVAALSLLLVGGEPAVVVMTAAADTDVVLPGEAASPGVAGQQLPDGTRIVVSAEGEAVVGGVVLGPGTDALVVGGRIEVLDGQDREVTLSTTTSPVAPASTVPPGSGSVPGRSDESASATTAPRPQPTDRPTTSSATDRPATSQTTSGRGDDPVTTPPPTTSRPTTSTTAPTTSSSTSSTRPTSSRPRPEPSIDLTLGATGADRIVLDWAFDQPEDPDAWRVEAVSGDRVVTLVVLRDGSVRTTTVARIDGRSVGFRVVALDADGSAVLGSEVVRQPSP